MLAYHRIEKTVATRSIFPQFCSAVRLAIAESHVHWMYSAAARASASDLSNLPARFTISSSYLLVQCLPLHPRLPHLAAGFWFRFLTPHPHQLSAVPSLNATLSVHAGVCVCV